MKNKTIQWLVACAIFITVFGFYADYQKSHIVLRFGMFTGSNWNVPQANSYDIIDDAIARFEKKYPNVEVEYVSGIPKQTYTEWLSGKILMGDTPDVFAVLSEDFPVMAEIGILHELGVFANKDDTFSLDQYYEASLNAGYYQNKIYALPYESVPIMMFVNKTLLEKEGIEIPSNDWTWDEFYQICKQVTKDTDKDGILDQFGFYDYSWDHAVYSNGIKLFNESGDKVNINDEKVVEALSFTRKLYQLNHGININAEDFDNGNVAFCPMQFSQYRAYMPYPWRVKRYSSFEWDCITLPRGKSGDNISEVETLLMGISKNTKYSEYAWEFIKELCYSEETQMELFELSSGVSCLKDVTESEHAISIMMEDVPGESHFDMRVLGDIMEHGENSFHFEDYSDVMELIDNEMRRIVQEDTDIETELYGLNDKVIIYMQK